MAIDVVNLTAKTGIRVIGPLESWKTENANTPTEHLAGQNANGELFVFWRTPDTDWQVDNVTETTGQLIAGPVTSWQTSDRGDNVEHLAGRNANGDLLVYWRKPTTGWQVVNVSELTGEKLAGNLTSWQTQGGNGNAEHLSGRAENGDLLVYWWTPVTNWQVTNITQQTGQKITGNVTSWQTQEGDTTIEHLAGRSETGDLLTYQRTSGTDWQFVNVSLQTTKTIADSLTSWQTQEGNTTVEHLAGRSETGDLLVYRRTSATDWQVVNVSQIMGQKITDGLESYQVWDGSKTSEVLIAKSPDNSTLMYWLEPSQDWQVTNLSAVTGNKIVTTPESWRTKNGSSSVEHYAGISENGDLLVFEGDSTVRNATPIVLKVNAQDFKEGMETGLGELSTLLSSDLAGVALPILGNLGDRYVPDFLKTLSSTLANGMDNPNMLLNDFTSRLRNNLAGVDITVESSSQQIEITLDKAENKTGSVALDSNLGIPLLNLSTEGQASASVTGDLKLSFGFNKEYGFYINTNPSKTHFKTDLNANLSSDFAAKGTLGFLQLDLNNRSDASTGVEANFNAVLHDLDNMPNSGNDGDRLTLSELRQSGYTLRDLFQTDFSIAPKLGMKGKTSVLGKDSFPSLNLDLDLKWDTFKYRNGNVTKGQPGLEFNHLQLDMGSFISNFAKPIFTQVNSVIRPFRPIINILNTDTKIFTKLHLDQYFDDNKDKKVSLFEVGSRLNQLAGGSKFDPRFLNTIIALDEAAQALNRIGNTPGNITIDLGSHSVGNVNTDDSQIALQQQPITLTEKGSTDQRTPAPAINTFLNALKKVEGLGFPLLSNPTQAVNLLLGKEANLFRYDMPDLNIDFHVQKSFPIFWPLEGVLGGGFKATSNLEFGYDTYGLSRWQTGKDLSSSITTLTDGFYVVDQPGDELNLSAKIEAGFGVNLGVAKGRITGGIQGEAGIDLIDVDEYIPNPNWQSEYEKTAQKFQQSYQTNYQSNLSKISTPEVKSDFDPPKGLTEAKIRQDLTSRNVYEYVNQSDGKLRTSEITSRLSKPLDLFQISGAVNVSLNGYAKLLWKDWNVNFATFEIANFNVGGGTRNGITSNKYIAGATVFLDANFNSSLDRDEPFTYSNFDGSYNLNFGTEKFDKNGNGQIDANEGQWVSQGGFDTFTNQDIDVPLTAPGGYSMITPVTTVVNSLVQQGATSNQAEITVKQALDLPNAIQLSTFDPIAAMKQGDPNGKKVMAAHVEVNTLLDQATSFMQGAFSFSPSQISTVIEATITDQINAGKSLDLTNAGQIENLIKSASVVLQSVEPSQRWQNVLDISGQAAQVMASSAQAIEKSLKKPGSTPQTLERLSKLQAFLVSETSEDLQSAAAGTQSIAKVIKENTGKGLDAALKRKDAQEKSRQDEIKVGTRRNDILTGSKKANLMIGQQGNDRLYGKGGDDLLAGDQGNDWLQGDDGNDTLNGGSGKDTLLGGNGNDLLVGEQGQDILTGGKGRDRFRLNLDQPGVDRINDFLGKADVLEVSTSKLIQGLTIDNHISLDQFRLGSRAMDASDRFIYNKTTGGFFFDVDGKGGIKQVQIAALSTGLSMTESDIYVVA